MKKKRILVSDGTVTSYTENEDGDKEIHKVSTVSAKQAIEMNPELRDNFIFISKSTKGIILEEK